MPATPSPLHDKPIPKRVSKPTPAAEAAATVAESVVEATTPAARKSVAGKAPARKAAPKAASGRPAAKAKANGKTAAKVEATPATAPAQHAAAAAKAAKAHKQKLVRDSFTIPKDEYQVLEALKSRALGLEQHVRKSELLRAGIQALSTMDDRAFLKAVDAVPTLKTGRPKKG